MTGNYKEHAINKNTLPANVVLTGYISDDEYEEMLHSVDITIDLTSRENCLVCGAYESVAAEKPMILSNTEALRDYFSMGAVYTDHTSEPLKKAIEEIIKRKDELREQIRELKKIRTAEWKERKKDLDIFLNSFDKT